VTLKFDLSKIRSYSSRDIKLLDGRLRILKHKKSPTKDFKTGVNYTLVLYQVNALNPLKTTYISRRNLTINFGGWLEFNVTQVFQTWVKHNQTNNGFALSVKDESSCKLLDPYEFGIVSFKNASPLTRPFLFNIVADLGKPYIGLKPFRPPKQSLNVSRIAVCKQCLAAVGLVPQCWFDKFKKFSSHLHKSRFT